MQMSGHIHNLNASSPRKEFLYLYKNRVKPRATLDGTEKRKISGVPVWVLENTSSKQANLAQVEIKKSKGLSLLFNYT